MTKQTDGLVVVTGGSSGIGRAIVKRLLGARRAVVNLDLRAPDPLEDEHFIETDLADPAAIPAAFAAIAAIGPVVGLVNNAGNAISHTLEETTDDDFARLVPLNVTGAALCAKHAADSMKAAGWGRIVNISSRAALGKTDRTAYAATKGAITSMTRVWALELAPFSITVNVIGPGPIATELFTRVNPEGSPKTAALKASVPVGRIGEPDDIARAACFFLDRENGFVTGQTLYVCGGLTIGKVEI